MPPGGGDGEVKKKSKKKSKKTSDDKLEKKKEKFPGLCIPDDANKSTVCDVMHSIHLFFLLLSIFLAKKDASFSSYRAKRERSCALFKFLVQGGQILNNFENGALYG